MNVRYTKINVVKLLNDIEQFPIIRDEKTGLVWDRREFDSMTMDQAGAHIAKLNQEKFGGYTDWRLPTHDELRTLVNITKYLPATDKEAFPSCENGWYRSSTPDAQSPANYFWFIDFYDGESTRLGQSGFVRAVRSEK